MKLRAINTTNFMLVCGHNKDLQLDKNSTNKDYDGDPIIDQPCKFHADPSTFSSFSTDYGQTVWISHDGKAYVTGDNNDGIISGSLPRKVLPEDTEFNLQDDQGQPCKLVSVLCGGTYTLYIASTSTSSTDLRLIYCSYKRSPNPLFVNTGNRTPLSLYGSESTSGVIDNEGGIIILTDSVFKSPKEQVESFHLPDSDKPVKLACGDEFVIALGMSGRVYESRITTAIKFEVVKELSDLKVVDVSGACDFCFAVLDDGRVFARGNNAFCKLGLPEETSSVSKFTFVESLSKYKIVSVFNGSYHSIFKTDESKMIVCGQNDCGQLFLPRRESVFPPEEIQICKGFTFCVTGSWSSTAFLGLEEPPNFSNKKINQ